MIRTGISILAMFTVSALGADFSGTWTGNTKVRDRDVALTLDLKGTAPSLTGTLSMKAGKRDHPVDIKDVTVDGDKLMFSTTRKSKKGERTTSWTATFKDGSLELAPGSGKRGPSRATLQRKTATP